MAAALLAGCGSDSAGPSPTTSTTVKPALATAPRKTGEIVLQGASSPKTHGPVALDGRYRVRFQQYAPENPKQAFADQTPFVVDLEKRQGFPGVHVFNSATATGTWTINAHGRYYVDVSFGDFPYVVRFTPVAN